MLLVLQYELLLSLKYNFIFFLFILLQPCSCKDRGRWTKSVIPPWPTVMGRSSKMFWKRSASLKLNHIKKQTIISIPETCSLTPQREYSGMSPRPCSKRKKQTSINFIAGRKDLPPDRVTANIITICPGGSRGSWLPRSIGNELVREAI